jgi:hypothetical protein
MVVWRASKAVEEADRLYEREQRGNPSPAKARRLPRDGLAPADEVALAGLVL